VEEELAYLEAYLAIESVRFGDRLQVIYKKEYTDDARMPPFLLQPLIENAIKFGLNGQTGTVHIHVDIFLENQTLIITIRNPYDPLSAPARGTGFGLEGIRRRLYLLYGRDDLVQTIQEENTFTTILKIPQLHVQSIADR
jgi:LytS/YehU family sensor histidine kinase